MSLCINPACRFSCPDDILFCQHCGSDLLLQGTYRVTRLLSDKGGFSNTYEVQHQGKEKVLKVLKGQNQKLTGPQGKSIELLKREFEILSESNHPGIPKGEDYFEFYPKDSQVPLHCLVMEKIFGSDLQEYMEQRGRSIDEKCALNWLEQLAQILKEIHGQNLLHRDIKPSNIILQPSGQLVLIDFGAVGRFDVTQPGVMGTRIYTPNYAAPEQEGGMAIQESDLFSLGRTFVYLLTGQEIQSLYDPSTHQLVWHSQASQISPRFVECIDSLMRENAAQRPKNADQLLLMIQELKLPTKTVMSTQQNATVVSQNVTAANQNATVVSQNVTGTAIADKSEHPGVSSMNRKRWGLPLGIAGAAACVLGAGALWQTLRSNGNNGNPESPASPTISAVKAASCTESKLVRKQGNTYGTVEIGSKGVKGAVIQELPSADAEGFKFVARKEKIETRNVNAVKPDAQKETVQAVDDLFRELQSRFNIPCEQILIYGSSGVAKKAPHKDKLGEEIRQKTGRPVNFISPEDEAIMTFEGVVPEWRRGDVTIVDIGSGNSKGTFLQNMQKSEHNPFEVALGTVTFTDKVNEVKKSRNLGTFAEAAAIAKQDELVPQIQEIVQRKPGLQNTTRVYLSGGMSWALSTLTRPCEPEQSVDQKAERVSRFSRVTVEDINTFYTNTTRDRTTLFKPNLSACDDDRRKKVMKDIERIQKDVFSEDNLIAGAEILRAFSDSLNFASKEKIFFAQDAIDALPTGYLIRELKRIEKPAG